MNGVQVGYIDAYMALLPIIIMSLTAFIIMAIFKTRPWRGY